MTLLRDSRAVAIFVVLGLLGFVPSDGLSTRGSSEVSLLIFDRSDVEVQGLGPRGIIAEDINGDEIIDLVVANLGTYKVYQSQTLDVFFGRGDGTFALEQSMPAGDDNEPYGIAAADLRRIGVLDIIVPNKKGRTVSVYLGRHDGTFEEPKSYPTGDSWSVSAGDIDGDGAIDLAVGDFDAETIQILTGIGDGTFHNSQAFPATQGMKPRAVELGDLNGDGRLDLVVPSDTFDGRVAIFINNSSPGRLALSQPSVTSVGSGTGAALVHDLNSDGKLDIIASSISSSHVSVLLGNGDGSVAPPVHYWTGDIWPFGLALADLDQDEVPDLVVSGVKGPRIVVLAGDGRGGFNPPYESWVQGPSRWVTAADFDRDGRVDLAVGNYTLTGGLETDPALFLKTVSILLNRAPLPRTSAEFRVNCGGNPYVNSHGSLFAADSGFEGGEVIAGSATVQGTDDPELFRSAREGEFTYTARVTPGRPYTVNLYVAETIVKKPRKRQFNIAVNGRRAWTRFDILRHVPRNTAKIISINRVWPNRDGQIRIEFKPVKRGAICSAISVF